MQSLISWGVTSWELVTLDSLEVGSRNFPTRSANYCQKWGRYIPHLVAPASFAGSVGTQVFQFENEFSKEPHKRLDRFSVTAQALGSFGSTSHRAHLLHRAATDGCGMMQGLRGQQSTWYNCVYCKCFCSSAASWISWRDYFRDAQKGPKTDWCWFGRVLQLARQVWEHTGLCVGTWEDPVMAYPGPKWCYVLWQPRWQPWSYKAAHWPLG